MSYFEHADFFFSSELVQPLFQQGSEALPGQNASRYKSPIDPSIFQKLMVWLTDLADVLSSPSLLQFFITREVSKGQSFCVRHTILHLFNRKYCVTFFLVVFKEALVMPCYSVGGLPWAKPAPCFGELTSMKCLPVWLLNTVWLTAASFSTTTLYTERFGLQPENQLCGSCYFFVLFLNRLFLRWPWILGL